MTPNIPVDRFNYINSGVVLFNLKKIREDNKEQELDKFVNENKLYYPDQDAINAIFKNHILFLDNKYNSSMFTETAKNFKIYH
jgi:lipopolysaccharide biosynthesis glycosyltransferase